MPLIFLGKHDRIRLDRPMDTEGWIVPEEAPIMLGRIIAVHLVYDLCVRLERTKAVGKPLWNENLVPFGGAEQDRYILAEARGTPPYVDRNIKYRTRRHAQELGLREGRYLEVKTANHPFARGQGVILLHKINVNPMSS